MTPQDRLAAAIYIDNYEFHDAPSAESIAQSALAADPTIAADMELGRRIRDASDEFLAEALAEALHVWTGIDDAIRLTRAALTEGETA